MLRKFSKQYHQTVYEVVSSRSSRWKNMWKRTLQKEMGKLKITEQKWRTRLNNMWCSEVLSAAYVPQRVKGRQGKEEG